MPRLIVRTAPAHGDAPRYRAGLGPFSRDPVMMDASDAQARELMADQSLLVALVGGEPEPAKTATSSPGPGASLKRHKRHAGASK